MGGSGSSLFSRRLLIASVIFGLLVLCDILLFGFLIFRSLSQREIDRVLLETRSEARELARRIEDRVGAEDDLFLVMVDKREVVRYIDSDLVQRDLVATVEIFDREGNVVLRREARGEPSGLDPGEPVQVEPLEGITLEGLAGDSPFQVSEAIGDLGTLRIMLSPSELRQRTAVLRRDLIRQTVWIGVVSFAVLVSAYAIIGLLLARARRLAEQAEEADRLAYIGTLAAGLAHEIRNPLNSLNLNMQMLEEEVARGCEIPSGRRLLSITRREITRLEQLVTDFLLYARPRPLETEEVAPGALLERVRELLAGEAQLRGARLRVVDQSGGAAMEVDPAQITQLLLNLAHNALAATEESARPAEVVLAARRSGPRVTLAVEDNGVGIPPETRERIFDLFYSTRKGGTGLGLAVVERIARAHGGEVEVASEVGRGTAVSVALPAAPARHPAPAAPAVETEAPAVAGSKA